MLNKGLTFVDTPPQPDIGVLAEDLSKFHLGVKQNLAATKFLSSNNPPDHSRVSVAIAPPFSHQKFKNPSSWNPTCPLIVEHMSLLNEEQLLCDSLPSPASPKKFNLTQAERCAKVSLMKNTDIIIKKADKGSAVVVQNRTDYIKEGLRQLSDRKIYRLQDENLTEYHNKLITEAVLQMFNSGEIDKKTTEFLILENPRTPNF